MDSSSSDDVATASRSRRELEVAIALYRFGAPEGALPEGFARDEAERAHVESITAEYAEYAASRDEFLTKARDVLLDADPGDPVLYISGYGSDDVTVATRGSRDDRQSQWEEWEREQERWARDLRERERLDEVKASSAIPAQPREIASASPATRPRGRRTRRVGGQSARGSGRRSDDPEPPALGLRAPLPRGAR